MLKRLMQKVETTTYHCYHWSTAAAGVTSDVPGQRLGLQPSGFK